MRGGPTDCVPKPQNVLLNCRRPFDITRTVVYATPPKSKLKPRGSSSLMSSSTAADAPVHAAGGPPDAPVHTTALWVDGSIHENVAA